MNRNLLTDEERATLAEQWPELVVKHTNGGACNFQAAADELVSELRAEIERLREENSTFSDSLAAKADRIDRLGEAVARQVAEIERLHKELRLCIHVDKHIHITSLLNIEIERLRGELAMATERSGGCY